MKERLDVLLVNRGLAPSREKAKTMIMEGNVFVNNNREDKAGSTFPDDCNIEIHGKTLQYVSRGGLKLEKAMKHFDITMDGKVCMDIGARALLKDGGEMVCLIKPQFEAGREKVGKKGVVRDKSVHEEVVNNIISFALSNGFSVLDLEYSPIKGPEGNIEYLVHIKKTDDPIKEESVDIHSVVEAAHGELDRK